MLSQAGEVGDQNKQRCVDSPAVEPLKCSGERAAQPVAQIMDHQATE